MHGKFEAICYKNLEHQHDLVFAVVILTSRSNFEQLRFQPIRPGDLITLYAVGRLQTVFQTHPRVNETAGIHNQGLVAPVHRVPDRSDIEPQLRVRQRLRHPDEQNGHQDLWIEFNITPNDPKQYGSTPPIVSLRNAKNWLTQKGLRVPRA